MIDIASLFIIRYPDPRLRRRAQPIAEINDEVRAVAQRMVELMHEARGVGLAAPQVGLSWRLFVANSGEEGEVDRAYINPVLKDPSPDIIPQEEGCLSIPDVAAEILRPSAITIEALDLDGNPFTLRSNSLLARVWQHEYDHLEGRLILDRFGQMAKLANRRAIRDLERAAAS